MAVKLVPQVERLLVEHYADGHSLRETADKFDVHVETVRRLVPRELIRPHGGLRTKREAA